MNEGFELSQHQGQVQTLTPLQVQYVKLLEMNAAAVDDEVMRRLDENPALEAVEPEVQTDNPEEFGESAYELQRADYRDDDDDRPAWSADNAERRRQAMENDADYTETLAQLLMRQLAENTALDADDRAYAEYIVGNLDGNGRLTRTLEWIADDITAETGVYVVANDLRRAYAAVRALDPAGVGAVDLRDCLLLQLDRREQTDAVRLAARMVDSDFDLVTLRRFDKLAQRMRVSEDKVRAAFDVVQSLNPRPGNAEADVFDRAQHIAPDFTVEPLDNGRFAVSLCGRSPQLGVAQWTVTAQKGTRSDAAAFARSRAAEATEFIDLLKRRRQTLLAVMHAIVKVQHRFFETEDPADIRPMILREVAAMVDRDISVVSRATAGKYVATPGGVYPLKMFFNERPTGSEDVSSHRIQQRLRQLVEAEDPRRPLSDEALTALLNDDGFQLARRTVAKYREELDIPNSRHRRR